MYVYYIRGHANGPRFGGGWGLCVRALICTWLFFVALRQPTSGAFWVLFGLLWEALGSLGGALGGQGECSRFVGYIGCPTGSKLLPDAQPVRKSNPAGIHPTISRSHVFPQSRQSDAKIAAPNPSSLVPGGKDDVSLKRNHLIRFLFF